MRRRFIPFTRLSIVFILAMVLSGGILTYFSINNISNLKELTEKRILEEERELAARFSISLQDHLEILGKALTMHMEKEELLADSLIQLATDHDFISQAFLLKRNGEFIFPYFTGISEQSIKPVPSDHFLAAFELGENVEFIDNNPAEARDHYLSCLRSATSELDSVTALNALGRVSVKSGNLENAIRYYSSIIQDHYQLSDRNGFPYAYYALPHLLNHVGEGNVEEIVPVIKLFLERMGHGFIPLNYQTEELLALAREWSREQQFLDSIRVTEIDRSIKAICQQLQFVNLYDGELDRIVQQESPNKPQENPKGFRIETLYTESDPRFFLFQMEQTHISGFLIDQTMLFDTIVKGGLHEGLEFDYLFAFPAEFHASSGRNSLSYSASLAPWFPEQTLQITIGDQGLISDLVRRRSWIYGIASVLLLVAMLLGIILTTRDITREKRMSKLRSDFISNVTHELKTPLTSIRMYAESLMMRRVKSIPGQRKYLSVVVNESERLKRMINNILEFSKMEKARQEYRRVESNLSEILQTAILDMNYWMEKKGFILKSEIEPDIKAVVDPEKFYQVYTNLLSNAIKYSGDSRKISVRLYRRNDSLVTEVEDEGIGIANNLQAKIFDEFFRVENHESGNVAGTGLGLTVVKEIVEAHHGRIDVKSEIGKGSKFSVIL
jgi:signal transduction histidine kinase